MKQFKRSWSLKLYSKNDVIVINNLRVGFDVAKGIDKKPNVAKINVWNLSLDNIERALKKDFKNVTLEVGYQSYNLIFKGDILKANVLRDGLDTILSLDCSDGFNSYANSYISISLNKGVTDKEIFSKLANAFNVNLGQYAIDNKRELPRGKVLDGNVRDLLTQVANNNNADWSIQDNELILIPKNKVLKNEITIISQETGMIKSPQKTDSGLEVSCLLNPNL